jgi:CheY-like chemotaxis protein
MPDNTQQILTVDDDLVTPELVTEIFAHEVLGVTFAPSGEVAPETMTV